MAEPMPDDEKLRRGRAAAELLANPLFLQAVEDVESDAFKEFANSRPADTDRREAAYQRIVGIRSVGDRLRSWVNTAKVMEANKPRP